MQENGAKTIAQDGKNCVVFGVPKEAIKLGALMKLSPLSIMSGFRCQER